MSSTDHEKLMARILAEVTDALPRAVWNKIVPADPEIAKYQTRTFQGHAGNWRIVVVDFDIEDQGFPPGSRGYDGAATDLHTVIHLPRDLAEHAFKLAEKNHGT